MLEHYAEEVLRAHLKVLAKNTRSFKSMERYRNVLDQSLLSISQIKELSSEKREFIMDLAIISLLRQEILIIDIKGLVRFTNKFNKVTELKVHSADSELPHEQTKRLIHKLKEKN